MKCKYCGKETTGEICDDCVAKLAHRNAGNTESALNTAPETEKPAMSSYFAANYGKKGAISSFVCGILGIIVAYVAVFLPHCIVKR